MYSVDAFGSMIADQVRMSAYVQALEKHVKPDSVVLDIGTGTGIFALLACRFGARKVYAIEPNEAIQVARELAAANGYADRIEFIEDLSTRVTLPERRMSFWLICVACCLCMIIICRRCLMRARGCWLRAA